MNFIVIKKKNQNKAKKKPPWTNAKTEVLPNPKVHNRNKVCNTKHLGHNSAC